MPRRFRPAWPLCALLALAVGACTGGTVSPSSPATPVASAGSPAPSLSLPTVNLPSPGASGSPGSSGASGSPRASGATPSPASPSPSGPPGGGSPTPSPLGDAASCTGSPDNQAFFASINANVSWAVYCAVLPSGWYVQQGSYQLDGGGQMTITYKGPAGVHLQLREGVFCSDPSSCAPSDQVLGSTAYGDRTGTLVTLSPGYAVYVAIAAGSPGWAAATVDLDEGTFVRLVAALHHITRP